uniref:uncharacterized protein LOC122590638 n=1 Tax=Erigeron canadensis TaxID=72917 RepID=UPI001CB8A8A3|nr:uncharacterized protein LOC122590638 [Erigeron canadensis]XP_043618750.1 uncharacterized protein LOC122590638 [Erigeron canadensis]
MVEPMVKAAIEISTLLARSFFMGFSTTLLALLARLRDLTQQILLDVVLVFNMVSSLSNKRQSIKLNQEGIDVFREYCLKNEEAVFLECIWETDKFILLEQKSEPENKLPGTIENDVVAQGLSAVEYQSFEIILGDNKPVDTIADWTPEKDTIPVKMDSRSSQEGLTNDCKEVGCQSDAKDLSGVQSPSIKTLGPEQLLSSRLLVPSDLPVPKPEPKKKVAFISVKRPQPSNANDR